MADNQSNNVLVRELPMVLTAHWEADSVTKIVDSDVDGNTKPTILVGSKRRQKVASFPILRLKVKLVEIGREAGTLSNVVIDELEGKDVLFEVTNKFYRTSPKPPIEYRAKLHVSDSIEATYELNEAELRDVVFKKDGQLDAKVNENLLDFLVTIPALDLDVESSNRVVVYRNRVIVFVPGLLGSTIAIKTSTGLVQIYPNIFPTMADDQAPMVARFFEDTWWLTPDGFTGYVRSLFENRKLGVLECDAEGHPLFDSKADLFQLLGAVPGVWLDKALSMAVVYDVQDMLAARWDERRKGTNRPKELKPFSIVPWPYDWRLDLEDSAQQLFRELQALRDKLLAADDTDDLFALSGHSTGGVINRRVCCLPGVEQIVEQCFFMNVPFRGAPKAMSVMLFGGDPPMKGRFKPMMPGALIDADSMVHNSVNLPIVYYLAPSNAYPDVVSQLNDGVCEKFSLQQNPNVRDEEKENLINAAIGIGFYQPVCPLPPCATLTHEERAKLAFGASEYLEKWWDCGRRNAFGVYWDPPAALEAFNLRELAANENLIYQGKKRLKSTIGWNTTIAKNATKFHYLSETQIKGSPVELYIFWSQKNPTTGSVDMRFDGSPEAINIASIGIPGPIGDYFSEGLYPKYDISRSSDFKFQWLMSGSQRQWVKFSSNLVDGDGTVPRASLLGIGTDKAKIFAPIPGDPDHVPSPNYEYVWDRVLDVLTDRDIGGYLVDVEAKNVPWVDPAPPSKGDPPPIVHVEGPGNIGS